jgi:tRNA(fMet)-specific endonuclease VapC
VVSPKYLLDTDTCIHFRRARSAHLMQRFAELLPGDVAMSVVTYGELFRGTLRSPDPARAGKTLQRVVELAPVLSLPALAGARYGEIRFTLERAGMTIGANDLWIAAHALASGLTVVTGNIREFRRVDGLSVEDWISPQ